MKWRSTILIVLLLGGVSCSRDPDVVKKKYLENGNKYFDRGKYKEASIMYRNALKKDMRYGEAYYRLGLTSLELQQHVAAARAFRRAVELLPQDSAENDDAKTKLADIYLVAYLANPRKSQPLQDDIKELATGLLDRNPESFDGLRLLGYLAWRDGEVKEAIERFEAAQAVRPMDPDLILALFQVLGADRRFEEAEELAKALIEQEKSYGPIYDVLYTYYSARNRREEGENLLKLKVDNNPEQAEYILQLARHYYAVGQREDADRTLQRLLSDPELFPDATLDVGDFYFQLRETDKAMEQFKAGFEAGGEQKLKFHRRIADLLLTQGKLEEARKVVEEILDEHPKDSEALAMRGALLLDSGDRKQLQSAISELQDAVTRMPNNPVVRFNLGRAHWAQGDLDQARTQFESAVSVRADYLAPRLALGQIQLLKGEHAAALQTANQTLALSGTNQPALLMRALSLRGMGNYDQARKELVAIIESAPDSVDARFQLGVLDFIQRNFKAAEQSFLSCKDTVPRDLRCFMGLVETYAALQQFDRAFQLLKVAQETRPQRSEISMALVNTAVRARQFDSAIPVLEELIAKDPQSSELHLKLGETYRRKGDVELAIRYFRKGKDLNPRDSTAHIPLALLLHTIGRHKEAMGLYEQILKLHPDNAVALNNLAYMIAELGGNLDEALTYAQRAKQKLPEDLNVSDTLGWIYIKKNLSSNAVAIYKDLVSKAPDNSTFRYHLAMALFQMGDNPQAKRELQAALRSKPSKEEEGKIRELMARIG
jgi:tetratricopeptide (TPR) repeat protein